MIKAEKARALSDNSNEGFESFLKEIEKRIVKRAKDGFYDTDASFTSNHHKDFRDKVLTYLRALDYKVAEKPLGSIKFNVSWE